MQGQGLMHKVQTLESVRRFRSRGEGLHEALRLVLPLLDGHVSQQDKKMFASSSMHHEHHVAAWLRSVVDILKHGLSDIWPFCRIL